MKNVAAIFILIAVIAGLSFYSRREKETTGRVVACGTGESIAGVTIFARQRGWGFANGSLVWDRDYTTSAVSGLDGTFSLSWRIGSVAQLEAKHEGYLLAEWAAKDREVVTMPLRAGTDPFGVTYNCKLSSECHICETRNRVETCRNVCFPDEF